MIESTERKIEDLPVIKPFIANKHYYIYDTYYNRVLEIKKDAFYELNKLLKMGVDSYMSINQNGPHSELCQLIKKGYFRKPWLSKITNPENAYVSGTLRSGISKLVLQVTQDCNFNCNYCLFAKNNNIKRAHAKKHMTWEIAQRSVDYLWEHSSNVSEVTIAFYGGEPLINFPLIRRVIEYSKNKFEVKNVKFSLTTNASILSDEMIEYFSKNNLALTISLDGPEQVQNRHRKFCFTGKGSFRVVWDNVLKIREKFPEWFDANVKFHPVILPGEDPNCIFEFFSSNSIPRDKVIIVNANMEGIDYNIYTDTTTMQAHDQNSEATEEFLSQNMGFFKMIYEDKNIIPEQWHHNGPCLPGKSKMFVDINGDIYPCEQVVNVQCNSIGNIFSGIIEDRVIELMNIGNMSSDECKSCFAMRYCNICMKKCYNPETQQLDEETKKHYCINTRKGVLNCLKRYVSQTM